MVPRVKAVDIANVIMTKHPVGLFSACGVSFIEMMSFLGGGGCGTQLFGCVYRVSMDSK